MRRTHSLFLTMLMAAASSHAAAQAPPVPPSQPAVPAPSGSANCTPTQPAPGQGTLAPGGTTGANREPLGDQLAKSDGVLCPPAGVDPDIRAPTPDTGTTPIIRPPGPGGDPTVRPK